MKKQQLRNRKGKYTRNVIGARWCLAILLGLALLAIYGYSERKEFRFLSPEPYPNACSLWEVGLERWEPQEADPQSVESFIRTIFGKNGRIAVAVAKGECRGLHSLCKNVSSREYSVCQWQINLKAHWNKVPGKNLQEKEAWLTDHRNCTLMAKVIFEESGWFPWTSYTSGNYRRYL